MKVRHVEMQRWEDDRSAWWGTALKGPNALKAAVAMCSEEQRGTCTAASSTHGSVANTSQADIHNILDVQGTLPSR